VNLDDMVSSQAQLLDELPGQRIQDWALSPTHLYSLRAIEGHQPPSAFTLSLKGVGARRAEHLQGALVTRADPHLGMDQRYPFRGRDGS
jgi:hypothetical protein